jgi:hypothetical protein
VSAVGPAWVPIVPPRRWRQCVARVSGHRRGPCCRPCGRIQKVALEESAVSSTKIPLVETNGWSRSDVKRHPLPPATGRVTVNNQPLSCSLSSGRPNSRHLSPSPTSPRATISAVHCPNPNYISTDCVVSWHNFALPETVAHPIVLRVPNRFFLLTIP